LCKSPDPRKKRRHSSIDVKVREQLENLLEGKTEGWGSADKGELFVKSGGERIATDAWH